MGVLTMPKALTLALALAVTAPGAGAQGPSLEQQVKAAFVFNFARFVTWPADKFAAPDTPVRVCLMQGEPFADVLAAAVAGKTVANRPLRIETRASAATMTDCHVAYAAPNALGPLAGHHVLTIHEGGAPRSDGIIRFYLEDNRVRFEINAAAASREELQLSSKLLSLARVVNE